MVDTAAEGIRLNKRLAQLGLCSRREADRYIADGLVRVDGQVVRELGTKVRPDQRVELSRAARQAQDARVTVLIHKPVGLVSAQPEDGYRAAVELLTEANLARPIWTPWERDRFGEDWTLGLAPAGRLDIDSSGLLVMTQDGRVARALIGEDSDVEKEYVVHVRGEVTPQVIGRLRHGLSLDGQALRRARVDDEGEGRLRFVLRQGRKRQIRRMCTLVGLEVTGLKRVRIGRVHLGGLGRGRWRFLRPDEAF